MTMHGAFFDAFWNVSSLRSIFTIFNQWFTEFTLYSRQFKTSENEIRTYSIDWCSLRVKAEKCSLRVKRYYNATIYIWSESQYISQWCVRNQLCMQIPWSDKDSIIKSNITMKFHKEKKLLHVSILFLFSSHIISWLVIYN